MDRDPQVQKHGQSKNHGRTSHYFGVKGQRGELVRSVHILRYDFWQHCGLARDCTAGDVPFFILVREKFLVKSAMNDDAGRETFIFSVGRIAGS